MAQRPSFDMTRLSTADKILLVGSILLFIDSFLSWQKACASVLNVRVFCASANAWGGNGSFAGVLMAILALILFLFVGASALGVSMPNVPVPTVAAGLAAGTAVFGLIKFLFAVTNHGSYGAWIGLILAIVIGYGAYMKMQESNAVPGRETPS
jgi:hypothetical protein